MYRTLFSYMYGCLSTLITQCICVPPGVKAFGEEYVSQNVLKRLLTKNIVRNISLEENKGKDFALYKAGSPANYFTLVLEGCMQVHIGKDDLEFESRSFSHFGDQALPCTANQPREYIPDFTVRPITDCQVLIVTRRQYLAACNATIFEREGKIQGGVPGGGSRADVFTREWEIAESSDLEVSQMTGSGLSPITKLLHKKKCKRNKRLRKRRGSDQELLLADGSTTPPSTPSDDEHPFSTNGEGNGGTNSTGHAAVVVELEMETANGDGSLAPNRTGILDERTHYNSSEV